ncbi:glutathione S-transferase 1 [Folsomia candida]|uniref:glutathione S-transferase 1 n=1 Tax=Folsomia candida TaxID=158441 RepID=UPI000B8F6332|nr:glutathione S-transferase 1 [Folsomia candida]XP_035703677.1 glutathione S-transferase 1 [Folsomia candida]
MTYKLKYFNMRGRGEDIRLLFAAAGVKFTDERISNEDWPGVKDGTPWGQLPTLEINSATTRQTLAQSVAICRYIARKFSLTGANEWEAAKCDEYVDAVVDLFAEWVKFVFEPDADKKAKAKEAFVKVHMPAKLKKLNMLKNENGGNFLVGKNLTWADIFIADKLERLETSVGPKVLDGYPHLRKLKEAVFNVDKIRAYLAARPEAAM